MNIEELAAYKALIETFKEQRPDLFMSESEEESSSSEESIPIENIIYNMKVKPELTTDLIRIEKRMTELTDGDDKLISHIIEYSLLLGKDEGIYTENVEFWVYQKYPDINTNFELREKQELFTLIGDLCEILLGNKGLRGVLSEPKFISGDTENYLFQFRKVIEREIDKIFFPGDIEDNEHESGIIGETTEQLNDIDIQ